ncbi:MAG: hypothetical protein QM535_20705 [Limnohabitans sp.]|nr:hypothetical protein [Limnohabitans sp.]
MENEKSILETINSVKFVLNQLEKVPYGPNAIQNINIPDYVNGDIGFELLKTKFEEIDFSKLNEYTELDKKIQKQKKELKDLENKHSNLIEIIGDNIEGKKGSVASLILLNLQSEIEQLIERRDNLEKNISINEKLEEQKVASQKIEEDLQNENYKKKTAKLEELYKEKEKELNAKFNEYIADINTKKNTATQDSNKQIKEAEKNAIGKVKLINQFRDFLEETNKNMNLYNYVILGILIAAIGAIWLSIPNLLKAFESYDTFIKTGGTKITNWQIINYALGLLIVKLPWALCLSAVLTGMYSLLKGLVVTYEKINQDKRNMSAIYAISGNVAQALNEYGISLADEDIEDEETGQTFISIRVTKKELEQKKENIRWNQIMKYFEGMQKTKIDISDTEDESKLKLVSDLLNKMIEKIPKA